MRLSLLLSLLPLFLARIALAQCPAVEFESKSSITSDPAYVQGIAQLAPGSFIGVQIAQQTPFNLIAIVPHIERQLINCYQKSTLGSSPPAFQDYSPGAASMPVNMARLNTGWTIGGISLSTSEGASTVTVVAANAPFQLTTNTSFTLPGVPSTGLFADLNHDGFADLVVVGLNQQTKAGNISILLGNGDGTFQNPVSYAADTNAVSVCVGDFNGDGDLDLAVATQSSVMLLAGNGSGSFSNGVSVAALATGSASLSIAAADLNGDGHPDLVVTTRSGLLVLLGNGSGSFTSAPTITPGFAATFTAIGDFNLDGIPDLALAYPTLGDVPDNSSVSILLGNGDGTFAAPVSFLGPNNTSYLVVTDVNGDGKPDIAVAQGTPTLFAADDASGKVTTLLGNGDGTFQAARLYPAGSDPVNMTVADVNGDGLPDLIVVNSVNSFGGSANTVVTPFETFLNHGDGTFSAPFTGTAMTLGDSVAAADFNGDGKPDIAIAGDNVSIQFGNGDGTFTAGPTLTGVISAYSVTAGDFNGDGKPDLLIAMNNSGLFLPGPSGLAVARNTGNGAFAPAVNFAGSLPDLNPVAVVTGDFNRDGKLDIAVADAGSPFNASHPGGLVVFLGNGDGTFQTGNEMPAAVNPVSVAAADLNGDGILDIAVSTGGTLAPTDSGYELAVFIGNGDGTFQPAVFIPTDFGPGVISIADMNGDGKPDLVVNHCCGLVRPTYLLGNGDGTFQAEVMFSVGTSPSALLAADLNGDGKPDVAALSRTGLAILINHSAPAGITSVSAAGFVDVPLAPNSIVSAFGYPMATGSAPATTLPLPLELAGAALSITDSTNVTIPVPLFYASPLQVNFLVPGNVAYGFAQLSDSSSTTLNEAVQIVPFSPSVFVLSGNLVAGYLTRVTNGVINTENVYNVSGGVVVPRPIPLPTGSDELVLTIFGTGLRGYDGPFSAMIGNQFASVLYAGPQNTFAGLDQVNVELSSTLPSGTLPIEVGTFTGGFSNTTTILIQ